MGDAELVGAADALEKSAREVWTVDALRMSHEA